MPRSKVSFFLVILPPPIPQLEARSTINHCQFGSSLSLVLSTSQSFFSSRIMPNNFPRSVRHCYGHPLQPDRWFLEPFFLDPPLETPLRPHRFASSVAWLIRMSSLGFRLFFLSQHLHFFLDGLFHKKSRPSLNGCPSLFAQRVKGLSRRSIKEISRYPALFFFYPPLFRKAGFLCLCRSLSGVLPKLLTILPASLLDLFGSSSHFPSSLCSFTSAFYWPFVRPRSVAQVIWSPKSGSLRVPTSSCVF